MGWKMKRFLMFIIVVISVVGLSASQLNNSVQMQEVSEFDYIGDILDELDSSLEDIIDIDAFTILNDQTFNSGVIDLSYSENMTIDDYQYEQLSNSIMAIFDDLDSDTIDYLNELASEDNDMYNLLTLIENGFSENNDYKVSSFESIIEMSTAYTYNLQYLLQSLMKLSTAAIITIKGAYSALVTTIQAWYIPLKVKIAVATAAVLAITAVVVINWNKVKPYMENLIAIFVDVAGEIVKQIKDVFQKISAMVSDSLSRVLDNVYNDFSYSSLALPKGWTKEKLQAELLKAIGITSITQLTKQKKITVSIGRVATVTGEKAYYEFRNNNIGEIVFHMTDLKWRDLEKLYKEEGMWVLNQYFLDVVMALDCDFRLVTPSYAYFNYSTGVMLQPDGYLSFYSRELRHIKVAGYRWYNYYTPYTIATR